VRVPNTTMRDKRLSIEARGVLVYLLSHSEDFEFSAKFLEKELNICKEKLQKIIRQLKITGYLSIQPGHKKSGKFSGQEWFIFAESQNVDFTQVTFDRLTEKPSDVKTVRRKNRQTENTSLYNKDLKEKGFKKQSEEKEKEGETRPRPRKLSVDEVFEIETVLAEKENSYPPFQPTKAIEIYQEIFPNHQIDGGVLQDFAIRLPEVEESVWRRRSE